MKTGKTTTAASFPDALLLGFETGWLTLPGVMATPVNKWSEFKMVIKQLKKEAEDAAKEGRELRYKNIIVDTVNVCGFDW